MASCWTTATSFANEAINIAWLEPTQFEFLVQRAEEEGGDLQGMSVLLTVGSLLFCTDCVLMWPSIKMLST